MTRLVVENRMNGKVEADVINDNFSELYQGVTPVLVADLPAASVAIRGARAIVTNATATTFASTVAGGGANVVPVFCNGTVWVIG